eukprot:gb/GFBE01055231.1/.p1 GENE.gb/GFBE01055231.1/~~gb/GFBE01055231.1/.p1  ORF type:complete len:155 (+),score=33.16 gb/GFBE01055231.1/:1-465(+)
MTRGRSSCLRQLSTRQFGRVLAVAAVYFACALTTDIQTSRRTHALSKLAFSDAGKKSLAQAVEDAVDEAIGEVEGAEEEIRRKMNKIWNQHVKGADRTVKDLQLKLAVVQNFYPIAYVFMAFAGALLVVTLVRVRALELQIQKLREELAQARTG